jgi:hypothetical protein
MIKSKFIPFYLLFSILLLLMTSCGGDIRETTQPEVSDTETISDVINVNVVSSEFVDILLKDYNGDFFSIKKPDGWTIDTVGEYESFGFRIYDPGMPARQIFFYGVMQPFMKSSEARDAWQVYLDMGGYTSARIYTDAPVLIPATASQFFREFNVYTSFARDYGIEHTFPLLTDIETVESMPRDSPMASVSKDDSVIRGLFTHNGIPCEGLFAASVVDAMTSYMYNVDAGYYVVYVITGISAPSDEFYLLQDLLSESLASFKFTEEYIQQGISQNIWETNAALEVGRTLSEASDSYNRAWDERQQVYDVISRKNSDSALGYDRIYDTQTGDVYRAETGFFDVYDANRDKYSNSHLQLIPDNDYELYDKELSGYIYK